MTGGDREAPGGGRAAGTSLAERADKVVTKLLPVALVALVVYLYLSLFTGVSYGVIFAMEYGLVGYFALELVVKWSLSDSWRQFLRNHWLKLVLVLPFLRGFRMLAELGIVSRSMPGWLRAIPYAQKLSKVPMLIKKARPAILVVMAIMSVRDRRREREALRARGGTGDGERGADSGAAGGGPAAADGQGGEEDSRDPAQHGELAITAEDDRR